MAEGDGGRKVFVKRLRAQEKPGPSDKGLFLTQTSLECLSFEGGGEHELSRAGPAKCPGLAGAPFLPSRPFHPYPPVVRGGGEGAGFQTCPGFADPAWRQVGEGLGGHAGCSR